MSNTLNISGGADIGNGFVKTVLENTATGVRDVIDIPSSVAVMTRPNPLPTADEKAVAQLLGEDGQGGDYFNELDASFNTPLVPDTYRRVFGLRSLTADGAFEEFDTAGRASKAKQPLSKVLTLGLYAAKALKDYVREHGALPTEELHVTARAAIALPVGEFLRHRESYAAEFLRDQGHMVVIENFETKVVVRIRFVDVQVLAEGASAQYAIVAKGTPLMDAMLADVRSRSEEQRAALEGITAQDVLGATNTIGIDIGDGTAGIISFVGGKFNVDASRSFDKGYGSVLTAAIKAMEDQGLESGFTSRKDLAEFLRREPSALKRAFHTRVKQFVDQEAQFYAHEVAEQLGAVLRTVGATTEVGFVYGGGSGPIKDVLYPALLAKVQEMNTIAAFPVLYLDASYSRHLNREGLFIAAKTVEARALAATAEKSKSAGQTARRAAKKEAA